MGAYYDWCKYRVSKKKKNIHIACPSDWKGRLLSAPYVTTGILNIMMMMMMMIAMAMTS